MKLMRAEPVGSTGIFSTYVVYWCPISLRGIPPPHWWSGDSGSPGKPNIIILFSSELDGPCLRLTIRSRTLLETATLNGWNLLMAEKADNSTNVCGSLRTQGHKVTPRSRTTWRTHGGTYLAASLVPKVQYLTGILSLSVRRETTTSARRRR